VARVPLARSHVGVGETLTSAKLRWRGGVDARHTTGSPRRRSGLRGRLMQPVTEPGRFASWIAPRPAESTAGRSSSSTAPGLSRPHGAARRHVEGAGPRWECTRPGWWRRGRDRGGGREVAWTAAAPGGGRDRGGQTRQTFGTSRRCCAPPAAACGTWCASRPSSYASDTTTSMRARRECPRHFRTRVSANTLLVVSRSSSPTAGEIEAMAVKTSKVAARPVRAPAPGRSGPPRPASGRSRQVRKGPLMGERPSRSRALQRRTFFVDRQ